MMTRLRSFGFTLCGALSALGCGANISRPAPDPDCAAGDGYDFSKVFVDAFKLAVGAAPNGFDFGDSTPKAQLTWGAADVDPAQTCGHARVLDMQSSGHNDYGSAFFLQLNGFNASSTDGISFWAKSPVVASDKSVTLQMTDRLSDFGGGVCVIPPAAVDVTNDAMTVQNGTNSTNQPGYIVGKNDCGNFFSAIVHFTNEWQLYLLPYQVFAQARQNNIEPDGVDSSGLYGFGFLIPKEAHFELWIDQIGAYQTSSAAAGP